MKTVELKQIFQKYKTEIFLDSNILLTLYKIQLCYLKKKQHQPHWSILMINEALISRELGDYWKK